MSQEQHSTGYASDSRSSLDNLQSRTQYITRRILSAGDLAVSVTGVAGPDRDERGNPVGTVFIGFSSAEETIAERFDFGVKSRAEIREEAADEAFKLLEEKLKEA